MSESTTRSLEPDLERRLSQVYSDALVQGDGMNDFLRRFLHGTGRVLGIERLVLYDYDEHADTFDLLYFEGYETGARFELSRRLLRLDMRHALTSRDPYPVDAEALEWLVPLYFQETLEAVLLLSTARGLPALPTDRTAAFRLISRFLGLFMSSSRLPVNRREEVLRLTALERAREVHMSYLPARATVADRYEIFGYNQSSALVGGDYFDYFCRRPTSLQFVVADACGHGMPAAVTMCAFRDLLHFETHRLDDLSPLFSVLNRRLYAGTEQLQYLTALFCDFDERSGVLSYFNAGHYPPLLVRADGSESWLPGGGLPLGMFEDAVYAMQSCTVRPGDLLVLFTDGIVDLQNGDEDFFGIDGIHGAVVEHHDLSLRTLARELFTRAEDFSGRSEPEDDLTLFLMRFR